MEKWFWVLLTSILFVGAVAVVSILFFRENILTFWAGLSNKDQTEIQEYGTVKSWDSENGVLVVTFRAGGENTYNINLDESALVTHNVDSQGELDQALVRSYMGNDWITAFCEGDGVQIDYSKNSNGDYIPTKFTDQGPRICK